MMAMASVVILVPAYNEQKTVADVVRKAKRYGDVVVIDDASHDTTAARAAAAGAHVIHHSVNRGLGGALRSGFAYALAKRYEIAITMDADGQHEPNDIPRFIEKVKEGHGFVLGVRDLRQYPFIKKFGNFFLNLATNLVSGTNLKDTESGFRAFTYDALKKLKLKAERYEIAVEIVFEVGRNKIQSANTDIASPVYVKGVGFFDGIMNFKYLLRRRKRNIKSYIDDIQYVLRNMLQSR